MQVRLAALAALLAMAPAAVAARPVSWPGGWTLIEAWNPDYGSLLVHYTPARTHSVGLRLFHDRATDWTFAGPQLTWLAKRWNAPGAQANLYFAGALGAGMDGGGAQPGGIAEVQADWENRRFLVMGSARVAGALDQQVANMQMVRAGFAPFVADYGGVHLWLFGEVRRDSMASDRIQPAFVARLFRGRAMIEAGVTGAGGFILNSQFRF
jgi:hypothetical protein